MERNDSQQFGDPSDAALRDVPSMQWPRDEEGVVRLLSVEGIGPTRVGRLLAQFGTARHALDASPTSLAEVLRVSPTQAARMLEAARRSEPRHELERVRSCGGRTTLLGDCDFPALLRVTPDPPAALFVRGVLGADPEPAVAIVGSRRATPYGRLHAARIAAELAARGVVIVSGGARGIDVEAHRGALRAGGRTIAVLAAGLEHPYPPEHRPLFDAIVEAGGSVLTEQLPGVPPRAEFFPRRNRIVAGLSLATVVIEAANRSGALVTARIAVEDLSREVGCLPGRIDSAASAGCHRAIREGWATLVTSADEIVAMLLESRTIAAGAIERMGGDALSALRRISGHVSAPLDAPLDGTRSEANRRGRTDMESHSVRNERDSHEGHGEQTGISDDARTILAAFRGTGAGTRCHTERSEACLIRPGAGLDELESQLGWAVSRLAVATLELERRGLLERDKAGGFAPSRVRR